MNDLTASQRSAVTSDAACLLVTAGAGSGKTRVLTRRAAWLIEHGCDSSNIMLLTFTRKASGEMRRRIEALVPACDLGGMMAGTFHSVALSILNANGQNIGYRLQSPLTVYDEADAYDALQCVCRDLGFLNGTTWTKGLTGSMVVEYREAMSTTGERPKGIPVKAAEPLRTIWAEYCTRLRQVNAVDYGLTLLECLRLFDECPLVLEEYRARIGHVLVDEFQDTDAVQLELISRLTPPACLFAVGDIRQSIYGFRGARPDLVAQRFRFTQAHLPECFRCGDRIVDASNALIHRSSLAGSTLPMRGATGRSGLVVTQSGPLAVASSWISGALDDGYSPSEIAVLSRTHEWLREMGAAIVEDGGGTPYRLVGAGDGLTGSSEFRMLHAALALAVDPDNDVAFFRLRGFLGCDEERYAKIREKAAQAGQRHWQVYDSSTFQRPDSSERLRAAICEARSVVALADVCRMVQAALPESSVLDACVGYWRRMGDIRPVDALRWHAMRDAQDEIDGDVDAVTLATIHAAKGLEWPVVILIGMAENVCPSSQSIKAGDDAVDEERRVAYVGMTRSAERLYVLVPNELVGWSTGKPAVPSRFVGEALAAEGTRARQSEV